MKDYKRVKDPIYGYIKVPAKYMTNIVEKIAKILMPIKMI